MVNITLSTDKLFSHTVDSYVYIVEKNFNSEQLHNTVGQICPEIRAILKQRNFTANVGQVVSVPCSIDGRIISIIIAGIGDDTSKSISITEQYRRTLGQIVKEARACKSTSLAIAIPPASLLDSSLKYVVEQTVIVLKKALYHFADYITENSRKDNQLNSIVLVCEDKNQEIQHAFDEGIIIADAINQARHWIDMPPSYFTPQHLVEKAQEIARKDNLAITVFGEHDIIKMGMGGLASVSRGSEVDCALIILEHKAQTPGAPTLCFVGKGITFDSGGLSLKPADYMETMKEDMSGAAAVICAIDALAQLKVDINIIAIAPTSENLPSGRATKPGDIVTFYNGKTAEIKNTDAEGRLILADALSYAVKHYNPDIIVDLATLTGACSRALGPVYSGLFSEHEDLIKKLNEAGELSGDRLWQLPMGDDYKKAIVSTVADICNIGSKQIMAGASTAAHFLQHFVGDVAWAHIDIAGTAFDVPNISYYRTGATGVGVGLLVALAMNWKK